MRLQYIKNPKYEDVYKNVGKGKNTNKQNVNITESLHIDKLIGITLIAGRDIDNQIINSIKNNGIKVVVNDDNKSVKLVIKDIM